MNVCLTGDCIQQTEHLDSCAIRFTGWLTCWKPIESTEHRNMYDDSETIRNIKTITQSGVWVYRNSNSNVSLGWKNYMFSEQQRGTQQTAVPRHSFSLFFIVWYCCVRCTYYSMRWKYCFPPIHREWIARFAWIRWTQWRCDTPSKHTFNQWINSCWTQFFFSSLAVTFIYSPEPFLSSFVYLSVLGKQTKCVARWGIEARFLIFSFDFV